MDEETSREPSEKTMSIFIGVDPGKKGALAVLDESRTVHVHEGGTHHQIIEVSPMPMVRGGKKARDEYDISAIVRFLKGHKDDCELVTVEKSQPLPMIGAQSRQAMFGKRGAPAPFKPGSIAQFNRGVQRGFEWLLTALEIPFQLVPPKTWMTAMHIGTPNGETKQRSILAASRLFPDFDLRRTPRCRKPDDGIAEALLLAEFGRRTRNGGTT